MTIKEVMNEMKVKYKNEPWFIGVGEGSDDGGYFVEVLADCNTFTKEAGQSIPRRYQGQYVIVVTMPPGLAKYHKGFVPDEDTGAKPTIEVQA